MRNEGSRRPFVEIYFQAEVNRFEDEEFEELARRNCSEDPETRARVIQELRTMIYERGQCHPRRTDDAYLLRFLRCRRFIPALAHKLMVRYEQYRQAYPYLYDCDAFALHNVKKIYGAVMLESPMHGRIIIVKFGKWDTDTISALDVLRCTLLMEEISSLQPKLQILGITTVVDVRGVGIRHLRTVTPTVARQVVGLSGVSIPLHMHGIHIINYSWFLNTFFYIFKQFVPEAVWKRLYFHWDLASLHRYINPQYLPEEYGGMCGDFVTCEDWIRKIDKYKDEFLVQELRALGYTVNS